MIRARFEFKLQDFWVGVFRRRSVDEQVNVAGRTAYTVTQPRYDVWVCLLPCVPLHIVWLGTAVRSEPMNYVGSETYESDLGENWSIQEEEGE